MLGWGGGGLWFLLRELVVRGFFLEGEEGL